jgi:para-nitrobenzyl esterase
MAFKGIPYAAPPIGPDQFGPPKAPKLWRAVRDAQEFGATAPKGTSRLVPDATIPGDDFLNLNVWTPGLGGHLPVMVWIHGGSFTSGAGSLSLYDGTSFARDGVVLVTINYRLGMYGFLQLDSCSANLGLLDQIAALEWIQHNVDAFGGDPANVTVFGESSGAMSIGCLLAMPRASGLFRRAILQSGAAQHALSRRTAEIIGHRLSDLIGVPLSAEALADVPLERVIAAQEELATAAMVEQDPERWGEVGLNLMPFEPVIDGDVLPTEPLEAIASGMSADIDILIGTNTEEFRLFLVPVGLMELVTDDLLRLRITRYGLDPDRVLPVYREGHPYATSGELLAAIYTDWFYRIPAVRLAEAHVRQHNAATYLYEFGWQSPTFDGRLGACHAAEIAFVFDALHDESLTPLFGTDLPQQVADAMHSAWVAFASSCDPGWAAYETNNRQTMHFNTTSRVLNDPRPRERDLWQGHR